MPIRATSRHKAASICTSREATIRPCRAREQRPASFRRASALYASAFEGHSLRDRIILQAHAERQGPLAWIGFSSQHDDEAVEAEFMVLAGLEIASADQIDAELGVEASETA
jgi:hypothetical protein